MIIEKRKGDLYFSTNKQKLDINLIHKYLSDRSYWAKHIPKEIVKTALEASLCFAVYSKNSQVAFARAVTDYATFAYLADVFVVEEYQHQGIGVWMMSCLMDCLEGMNLRRMLLATKDAHTLYEKYGFSAPEMPEVYMEKVYYWEYESQTP